MTPDKKKKYKATFIKLGWAILEMKCLYYCPEISRIKAPDDNFYDKVEALYKKLGKVLKLPLTASDMVGFNKERASCRLTMEKLKSPSSVPVFKSIKFKD